MKNERIAPTIVITELIIIFFLGWAVLFELDLVNDKTNYILELQKENNQCNMQLDSIMQDYERLQNE